LTRFYFSGRTGKQRENAPQNAKNSIYVNLGGIKGLVESQYVSNHDFLEVSNNLTAYQFFLTLYLSICF